MFIADFVFETVDAPFGIRSQRPEGQQGRAANNCTTCFSGFKHKNDIAYWIRVVTQKKLNGFELGAPPHVQIR